jgi:hypothetical protein
MKGGCVEQRGLEGMELQRRGREKRMGEIGKEGMMEGKEDWKGGWVESERGKREREIKKIR